jgi:integrase
MRSRRTSSDVARTAHSVVEVPLLSQNGRALPLLLLSDEGQISLFAAAYLRNMQLVGVGPDTLLKTCKSIGLLYDFYVLDQGSPVVDSKGMQLLVKKFYTARRQGLASLGWAPVLPQTAKGSLRHITDYSLFCEANFGHSPLNPVETVFIENLSGPEIRSWLARSRNRRHWDMLYHMHGATQEGQGMVTEAAYNPEPREGRPGKSAKYFPAEHVLRFIHQTLSIRDRLCWLLLFFGGVRISELMHLFSRDISQSKDGTARVVFAHPVNGLIDWVGSDGRRREGTRAGFLADRYGLIPRNQLPTSNSTRAGWKGMAQDDPRRRESHVYWTDIRAGRLFWELHRIYMRSTRLRAGDHHPYYLVSQKGESFGDMLTLANLHKQFERSAERIGLSVRDDGINPHGARHFYGYYSASWLKLGKETVQKMLHHVSPESTTVYYTLDSAVVRTEMLKAQTKLNTELPSFMADKKLLIESRSEDE